MKKIIFNILLLTVINGCNNLSNEAIQTIQINDIRETKSSIANIYTPSYIIDLMYLQPDKIKKVLDNATPELKKLIENYELVTNNTANNFDYVKAVFQIMSESQNQVEKEYGIFGLLLLAYETENLKELKQYLDEINSLAEIPTWLNTELINYRAYYYLKMTDYQLLEELLNSVDSKQIESNSLLTISQSWLYIRNNEFDKAKDILERASYESLNRIEMAATCIQYQAGSQQTIDYLNKKLEQYPHSRSLALVYNDYLMIEKPKISHDNLSKLAKQHPDDLWLQLQIALTFAENINRNNLDYYNNQTAKLTTGKIKDKYLDGNLLSAIIPASKDPSVKYYLDRATEKNPMNYRLLWYKTFLTPDSQLGDNLKKLEHIDPYNNGTLIELANYYQTYNMNAELMGIKQRFDNSSRYKTQEEISIISQY